VPASAFGISYESIKQLSLTAELIADILEALDSSETVDQRFALAFAEQLLEVGTLDRAQEARFLQRLRESCTKGDGTVRAYALRLLVRFHSRVADFRPLILEALKSENSGVREEALRGFEFCCHPEEFEPLEEFEHDRCFVEIAMGGPLVFELRDRALETIERVLGVSFSRTRESEDVLNGQRASFYSWEPFHAWKINRKRRWF
jgi:hypothetical protein